MSIKNRLKGGNKVSNSGYALVTLMSHIFEQCNRGTVFLIHQFMENSKISPFILCMILRSFIKFCHSQVNNACFLSHFTSQYITPFDYSRF